MTREPAAFEDLVLFEGSLVDDEALEAAASAPPDDARQVGDGTLAVPGAAPGAGPGAGGDTATPKGEAARPATGDGRDRWTGKRMGHFRLARLIGSGVMGIVFLAEDVNLQRVVALKVLRRKIDGMSQEQGVAWFFREARAIASIEHPNIAQIFEINQHGGWWYIAMEYIEGGTVQNLLDAAGPLEPAHACAILADAARGLAEAHANGIVHRDIKPSNLMLTRRGRCKLVDFGVAGAEDVANAARLPSDHLVGTPLYIAPEIIRRGPALPAADSYSLAATIYVTLTGRCVFTGATVDEIFRQHLEAPAPDVRQLAPNVSESLARLINSGLAKEPMERPRAAALAAALQAEVAALAGRESVAPPAAATGSGPHPQPSPLTVFLPEGRVSPGHRGRQMVRRVFLAAAILLVLGSAAAMYHAGLLGRAAPAAELSNSIGMHLILVPAGRFTMGSPPDEPGRDIDERQLNVQITHAFYLGATDVTQSQWQAVMGSNYVSPEGVHPDDLSGQRYVGDTLPMTDVSWTEAQLFCQRLGQKEGVIYRLPTEAEWEYACRAGTSTPFAFGATLDRHLANIDPQANDSQSPSDGGVDDQVRPMPVGSFPPNAWGFYDMHGNVMQWCSDIYGDYPLRSAVDPQGRSHADPGGPQGRVMRGGSWLHAASVARSASRWSYSPVVKAKYIGFRVVREVPQ